MTNNVSRETLSVNEDMNKISAHKTKTTQDIVSRETIMHYKREDSVIYEIERGCKCGQDLDFII